MRIPFVSSLDHSQAPVLDALVKYRERSGAVYGPPGHKQGRGVDPRVLEILGAGVFASDVLMLNGLDDRRQSQGVLNQAQELMADAVHAEQAFFSTCGSSLSVKSAMLAIAGPNDELLVSRNSHKSVTAGLILAGINPVWVRPQWDEERAMAYPPEPDDVEEAFKSHPNAKGMLLISPTDWGTASDIAGVAEVCHARGKPLIVDEAWGAHLPFHDDLPPCAMQAGADLAIVSVHKMGMAIEQSSVFHMQGDRIDPSALSQRMDLVSTTSPSTLIYASLDGWRRQMVQYGEKLITDAMHRADRIRDAVNAMPGLAVLGDEVVGPGKAHAMDPLKITIEAAGLGIHGYQAAEWMRAACHIDMAAADVRRMQAQITTADDDESEERLLHGLQRLVDEADSIERPKPVHLPHPGALELEVAMPPRDAFFARVEQVPAKKAVGRVAAEMISPYPPGVPAIAPGEVLTQDVIDYLTSGVAAGMLIPDAADPEISSLRVVAS